MYYGASIHFLDFVRGVDYEGASNIEWAFIIEFTVHVRLTQPECFLNTDSRIYNSLRYSEV